MERFRNLTHQQLLDLLVDIRNTGEQLPFASTKDFIKEIEIKIQSVLDGEYGRD